MQYIAHRRFKGNALCGSVNLPATTELTEAGGLISYQGKPICYTTSENAHQYFARNDDGNGLERGKLTQAIQKTLAKRDNQYQERWDKVWDDPVCQPHKRTEYADYWLWNHDFFQADVETLWHIAKLVGAH